MANKTSFTTEEWGRLLSSPMVASMAITAADPSGVWGLLKEGMAGGWALVQVRQSAQANPLVKAIAEDFFTADGRSAARAGLQARFKGGKLERVKEAALAELRTISALSTPRLRTTLSRSRIGLDRAQKAAEACTEGGFLGFEGVAVSDAEKATLAEISAALSQSGTIPNPGRAV